MTDSASFALTCLVLLVLLGLAYIPLGNYMAKVYETSHHLRVEKWVYKLVGVDPDADQRWTVYLRSLLVFSFVSVLFLFAFQRVQHWLPLSLGQSAVSPGVAFNTAISFVTNTNWQSYSGESTMGILVQMGGLAVQNFMSAAVGMAVAVALIRGFVRRETERVGNFWVDLVRTSLRILLPLAFVAALVLLANGVTQNLVNPVHVTTLSHAAQVIPQGPIASQEAIKELGTNGGGYFNANSSHPYENPNPITNLLEIFLILVIPFALTRTFGRMVGRPRYGFAILGAMVAIFVLCLGLTYWAEMAHGGIALQAARSSMEGKEVRFGVPSSVLFGVATTSTSTGAVNSFFSSFTPFGGGVVLFDILLGEVSPGGSGSGLYGMLMLAILTVFIAGLMVGRTPEFLGKKIGPREMKLVSLYILSVPALILAGAGVAMALPGPRASILNGGPHGLTEVLYAYASAANNNGSAFAGLNANTTFYNSTLGVVMALGRLIPIIFVIALAGSLVRQRTTQESEGTMPADRPQFTVLLVGVAIIVTGLTYFPALALGPLAEGLH